MTIFKRIVLGAVLLASLGIAAEQWGGGCAN